MALRSYLKAMHHKMTEIIDRYNSLQVWQKATIIVLAIVVVLVAARAILDVLITIMLVTIPFSFLLIAASEDLQNRIKSSKTLSQLPGVHQDQAGAYVALAVSGALFAIMVAIILLRMALFSPSPTTRNDQQSSTVTTATNAASSDQQTADTTSTKESLSEVSNRFSIVYSEPGVRSDDGMYYYVLTDPIDISKEDIKGRVEKIVRSIAKANGNNITIDIFDDMEALNIQYRLWVIKDINEPLDAKQEALIERHQVASFEGGTAIGPSANTMIIFPNSTNKVTEVSRLSTSYEFNP